ncbi:hypothetical protein Tco_1390925, partial [Tanacetum coccineum]
DIVTFPVMPKGQPNKKKSKNVVFTIYLKYDGIFITNPLSYVEGTSREINDINFDNMSFNILAEIINKLTHGNCHSVKRLYYSKTGTTLALDIKELKSDTDVEDMLNASYDNGNMNDLFVEHYDYDVIGLIDLEPSLEQNLEDSDCYSSDDCEKIDDVDFQTACDDNVVIKDISTSDPFLNKLCSTRALFRGSRKQQVPDIDDIEEDLDNDQIDLVYKLALTNYGVAYSYQLWYMKNDWRSVLVYCGRNVAEGRCAGKKGNKNKVMPSKDRSGLAKKTNVGNGEGSSKQVKKSKVKKVKKVKKKHVRNDSGG